MAALLRHCIATLRQPAACGRFAARGGAPVLLHAAEVAQQAELALDLAQPGEQSLQLHEAPRSNRVAPRAFYVPSFTLSYPLNVSPNTNFGPGYYVKKNRSFPQ